MVVGGSLLNVDRAAAPPCRDKAMQLTPRLVEALSSFRVVGLAARGAHVLALDESGRCWSWGRGIRRSGASGAPSALHVPCSKRALLQQQCKHLD